MASTSNSQTSYWFIAVPAKGVKSDQDDDSTRRAREATSQEISSKTSSLAISYPQFCKNSFPHLRVGTLDTLMSLSDELVKYDTTVSQVVKKLEKAYHDLTRVEDEKKSSSDAPHNLTISLKNPTEFVETFDWDQARYGENQPLRALVEGIVKRSNKADDVLKQKFAEFNELKTSLVAIERKETGSLLVKPLAPYVKPSDLHEGEWLTTLLVVVPTNREQEFLDSYQTFDQAIAEDLKRKAALQAAQEEKVDEVEKKEKKDCPNVVPGSARKLAGSSTDEYVLYRIIAMKKGQEALKNILREKRYTVRPFKLDMDEEKKSEQSKQEMQVNKDKLRRYLIQFTAQSFAELLSAWIHLKVIRAFVESVLRYGPRPAAIVPVLLKPTKGREKQLRDALSSLVGTKDSMDMKATEADASHHELVTGEFYSYVYLQIDLDM